MCGCNIDVVILKLSYVPILNILLIITKKNCENYKIVENFSTQFRSIYSRALSRKLLNIQYNYEKYVFIYINILHNILIFLI